MIRGQEPPVMIKLLGTFELQRGKRVLLAGDWPRKKAAALLKRLAFEQRLLKDQAIDFLWPDAGLASAANNLYRTLHTLRQTLDRSLGEGAAEAIMRFEDGVLSLAPGVWVDVREFEQLSAANPALPVEQRRPDLEQALRLYRGDLLPDDLYEEWTQGPRQELYSQQRTVRLALATCQREDMDYASAIALLKPLLIHDPADEPVHRELMRSFALAGQRHEALRQYQACVQALAAEIDVPPAAETSALYARILSGELVSPPAPTHAPWSPPTPVVLEIDGSPALVGRATELKMLEDRLRLEQRGQGQTVLIAGDTGVGKTRLAMEALKFAVKRGMMTLSGAAYEQEGRLPFQPFIEAFDHFLAERGRSPKENPITHFERLNSPDPQQEHWALYKATANFILEIAKDAPLVFLVDDLHAADETSWQLFHFLARQTRSAPVVLMATYRSDLSTASRFNNLQSALYQEGLSDTIRLETLTREAVREILEDTLKGQVSEALCQAVYEITGGNPFFIQEMARTLLKLGQVEQASGYWSLKPGEKLSVPDNLSALLRQKVSRMGRNVEITLTAAAVIGREFSFEILRGVAALSNGEILDALDAALDSRLIEETPAGYRFRHPLIRRTLYESLSRVRRANLHTSTAVVIEATGAIRPGGLVQQIEALAYHYDLSDRRDLALPYLIDAGEHAAGVYAFEVAVDYFERALSLLDDLSLTDRARRWYLLESLGSWYSILADTRKAVNRFEQALGLKPGQDWLPASRDQVRLHCLAAVALITAGDMDAAEEHLETALLKVDQREDAPEYADLLYNMAQLYWHRNEYQQSMEAAQQSLAIANRLDKPDAIARAYEMLALACHSLGEWQAGIAYEEQRAELAGPSLDVTDAFDVHL